VSEEPRTALGALWLRAMKFMQRSQRAQFAALVLADIAVIHVAVALAYLARFEGRIPVQFAQYMPQAMLVATIVTVTALWGADLYRIVLRYVGVQTMARLIVASAGSTLVILAVDLGAGRYLGSRPVPIGVVLIAGVFAFVGLAGLRSTGRLWVVMSGGASKGTHDVLIVGAGDAGSLLLRDIETQPQLGYNVVGFLDDDRNKIGRTVREARVVGPIDTLPDVVERLDVAEILVAIPSLQQPRRREVLELCTATGVKTRIISGIALDAGTTGVGDLRTVKIEDLLGREPNEIDVELISETLTGKVVAVTGAAGSIGSELCRQIMKMRPAKLLLMEIDETRLYELYLELQNAAAGVAVMRICDVRDYRRVSHIFRNDQPQVVFHAAAYKHVPVMEDEPDEAIRANVLGTQNVLTACREAGTERFVLISTDKAVEPENVMGMTKAVAELVMLAAARDGVGAVAVRFGNVLGSRGSVVPLFSGQLRRGGPVKVTHPDVTRYFMTIPEAARLVLQAQAMSDGGDIFVLDMGEPVKIVDLARRMIVLSGVPTHLEFTGLRPGEKVHEILVHGEGALIDTDCPAVRRLNSVPLIDDGFTERLERLIREARFGDSPDIHGMLWDLAYTAQRPPSVVGEARG